jgi:hypothetical protein
MKTVDLVHEYFGQGGYYKQMLKWHKMRELGEFIDHHPNSIKRTRLRKAHNKIQGNHLK